VNGTTAALDPGSGSGVEAWVAAYAPELKRHLVRFLGSGTDADDVLQQVWIKALESPPDTGAGSNVRAWLYRVATNRALDCLAAARRRRSALARRDPRASTGEDTETDALAFAMSDTARARIRAHCSRLPRKQREAVWLRWVEGLDYPTIAERTDSTAESARANVYQGMKRLRVELEDLWTKEHGA
jgi:RNA polymerase sigma-70 factor (ECF subfamily)